MATVEQLAAFEPFAVAQGHGNEQVGRLLDEDLLRTLPKAYVGIPRGSFPEGKPNALGVEFLVPRAADTESRIRRGGGARPASGLYMR